MELFADAEAENYRRNEPLAARMRPRTLDEFVGQRHFLGEGKLLRRMIASRSLGSIILHGPPGTGKTTLARLLAEETGGKFRPLNAVTSGVKELREVLGWAHDLVATGEPRPILFVDEIHRFNRSQQDALLPDVESGVVSLVGATTSNPYFSINGALLSRSQLFRFEPIDEEDLRGLIRRALEDRQRGYGAIPTEIDAAALDYLARVSEGDARRALSALEIAVLSSATRPVQLTLDVIRESVQQKVIQYDGTGDDHYDLASALIKSIRGSDPDAAIYWLARMLEGGEEVRFLTRRLVILASEDIGNADPHALSLAVAAMQACEFVGLPECQLTLSQTVAYLACAPKSNAATTAIGAARKDVREGELVPVPKHLRDAHYPGAKEMEHGVGYVYSHNSPDGIAEQDYLGVDRIYYQPTDAGYEAELKTRLVEIRRRLGRPATSPDGPEED